MLFGTMQQDRHNVLLLRILNKDTFMLQLRTNLHAKKLYCGSEPLISNICATI